ncbi:hypothetical protein [Streptomyces hokutonensis]|uniref:BrnT family toxin n=1 Tax=Streptomyces hokutonensis TaxID=1306990 RepID=A0ABW6MG79_9ACTN
MAPPEQAEAFEWDDESHEQGNTAHLAESRPDRPSIAWWEAEQVFENGGTFAPNKNGRSGDWLLVGRTDSGRALSLVIHYDEARRVIRVITGWECTQGQRTRYL